MTITTHSAARHVAPRRRKVWTSEAIHDLGVTTDIETAGAIIGVGRSTAYTLARRGEFPVRVIRIGRRYVVPVADILDLLGMQR